MSYYNVLTMCSLFVCTEFEGDNLLYQSGTFFSGFESSSTTATFTLMELARKKECQDMAREDILNALDKHGWTYEAFNSMKYLDKCVAEGVRLHPSVSTIDRCTRKDYRVKNFIFYIEPKLMFDRFFRYPVQTSH